MMVAGWSKRKPEGRLARTGMVVMLLAIAAAPPAAAQDSDARFLQRAASSRALGSANAPVLVYEIADFQCPYCARFSSDVFPRLDSAFIRTGQVEWVFVNLPIPSHHRSWGAAKAAMCAGALGDEFWAMRGRIFQGQEEWSTAQDPMAVFQRYARDIGVPAQPFRACLTTDQVAPLLLADVMFAVREGVSGTPAFIIGGGPPVVGLKSFEEWREMIEQALYAARERKPR